MLGRSQLRVLSLLAALPVALVAARTEAQTVSCAGVADWNATTIYNPHDRLVFKATLYEAAVSIWNTPPDYCPSCG